MARSSICILLILCMLAQLLCGCTGTVVSVPETTAQAVVPETVPETTASLIPPNGNPNDVTCKGSYTGTMNQTALVAQVGEAVLSNEELSAWYWAEVGAYQASGEQPAPDFAMPLDIQPCQLDDGVNSWQQFFLRRALNTWHSAQSLIHQGAEEGLPVEDVFKPRKKSYDTNMTGMPATKFLYRYEKAFQPNTMHQAWLDQIPQMLEALAAEKGYGDTRELAEKAFGTTPEALAAFVEGYNRGYMYYTNLSYFIEPTKAEVEAYFSEREAYYAARGITRHSGNLVDIRHILLIPGSKTEKAAVAEDGTVTCSEELWQACEKKAKSMLKSWKKQYRYGSGSFGDMAFKNSKDTASALDGGSYHNLEKGQLIEPLDSWCFAEGRKKGDTVVLRSPYGVHMLYFVGSTPVWRDQAELDYQTDSQADILTVARRQYPLTVDYGAIVLAEGTGAVSQEDVLYPDVAHERFPEIPLYLQQDYPNVRYGGFMLRSNGCGITTMAMLATYMADEEYTPPEMCAKFGRYSFSSGTDGSLFYHEPPNLGFYLREKTYDTKVAKAALKEGQVVVSVQHKGYWTRGGHYIVIEKIHEDGTVQVRDSNIANYGRIKAHKEDRHTWKSIVADGSGYWIFEDKVTRLPACWRCGDAQNVTGCPLQESYTCHKCREALLRRENYLKVRQELAVEEPVPASTAQA